MYVIEHALLNLIKNKSRNILMGVIIFAIITAAAVALTIFNTTGIIIQETRDAMNSAVRVVPSGEQQMILEGAEAAVSFEQYKSFAESEYLDGADIKESSRSVDGVDAIYYLKQPDMLASFEAELRGKDLPDDYTVRTDASAYKNVVEPVENLQNLTITFLIIVLALGAVIMVLLSVIVIRERKYEIGVLRAMGMKKKKVALGLWAEIIAITCICFVLGMSMGIVLAQPVSDSIMSGQTQSANTSSTSLADRLKGADDIEQPQKIDITVSGVTVLQIFGVSLLLASIAGFISVSRITKSEPIKILMERN